MACAARCTLHSSGHRPSLLIQYLQESAAGAEGRGRRGVESERGGLYLFHRHRGARAFRGSVWPMAGDGGTSQGDVCRGYLLRVRISGGGCRSGDPFSGAHLSRLWSHRWRRAGAGLYLTGLDADQVVSRPAGTGYRPRDHGLRRRCDDRFAAGDQADDVLQSVRPSHRGHLGDDGSSLLCLYDVWRLYDSGAARGMEARGMGSQGNAIGPDLHPQGWMSTLPPVRRSSGCCGSSCA